MFRAMRRNAQQLPQHETKRILQTATSGVLAVLGDGDYPYAVPMSYVYANGTLYFHSAVEGHKVDAVRRHPKASFCVIARDDVHPQTFTTHFQSVIVFGRVRIVEDEAEKRAAIEAIARRYAPAFHEKGRAEIEDSWNRMHLIALDPEHITGKEARELMNQRRQGGKNHE